MRDDLKNFLQDPLDHFRFRYREKRAAEDYEEWLSGYETAADAFLGLLAKTIDGLHGKLGNLPKDEQVLLAHLHELRKAAEAKLAVARDPEWSPVHQDPQNQP